MFIRIFCAAIAVLFGGGFGFAIGGILSAIVASVVLAVFTQGNGVVSLSASFDSHPWGIAACLVVGGEFLGAVTGIWFAVRLSMKVFAGLPPLIKDRSNTAFVLFLILLTLIFALSLPDAIRLATRSSTTTGTVRQIYLQEHGTISYTYSVDGVQYERRGSPEHVEKLSPGEHLTVNYLPERPTYNNLHEPRWELFRSFASSTFVCAFLGIWLSVIPTVLMQRLKPVPQ